MRELNINLKSNENLYKTTYHSHSFLTSKDDEVEYVVSTPEDNEREETRLKNLKVKFTTEIVNHLVKHIDYKQRGKYEIHKINRK